MDHPRRGDAHDIFAVLAIVAAIVAAMMLGYAAALPKRDARSRGVAVRHASGTAQKATDAIAPYRFSVVAREPFEITTRSISCPCSSTCDIVMRRPSISKTLSE